MLEHFYIIPLIGLIIYTCYIVNIRHSKPVKDGKNTTYSIPCCQIVDVKTHYNDPPLNPEMTEALLAIKQLKEELPMVEMSSDVIFESSSE